MRTILWRFVLAIWLIMGAAQVGMLSGTHLPGVLELLAQEAKPSRQCPICQKTMEQDWKYCPFDGTQVLETTTIPERTPTEVVLAFYKAYAERNKEELGRCLDLENILSSAVVEAIDGMKGLSLDVRAVFKEKLVAPATRALIPSVLEILVSDAIAREFPSLEEISAKALVAFYTEKIEGDRARFIPLQGTPFGREIVLVNRNGRWLITKMPGL